ncbi:MAG: putative transposase [Colwellia sp.]|jgi:REP element-mobilizing transposase RayT
MLLYHLVFPAEYRRAALDAGIDEVIILTCAEIEKRYEIKFLEIESDEDHLHFLVQAVAMYSITKLVTMINA